MSVKPIVEAKVEVDEESLAEPAAPRVLFHAVQAAIDEAAGSISDTQWFELAIRIEISPNPGPTAYKVILSPPGT